MKIVRSAPWRPALLAVLLVLAGCGNSRTAGVTTLTDDPPRIPTAQHVIGPGDQLSVFVYQSPQLSLPSIPVRPDGRISMPLVSDIVAAGKTPSQLGSELARELTKYVRDPIVTVMVTGFVGPLDRQVRVIGEATDPTAIPYRAQLTVLDVMIQTRGLTRFAARGRTRRWQRMARNFFVLATDLGGLMIKVGQYLSSRLDVLPPHLFPQAAQVSGREYGLHGLKWRAPKTSVVPLQNPDFLFYGGVANVQLEQESVELSFGQAVGAFLLNGVLGG